MQGQEAGEIAKAGGMSGKHSNIKDTNIAPKTLKDIGLKPHQSMDYQTIANMPEGDFELAKYETWEEARKSYLINLLGTTMKEDNYQYSEVCTKTEPTKMPISNIISNNCNSAKITKDFKNDLHRCDLRQYLRLVDTTAPLPYNAKYMQIQKKQLY